LKASTIFEKQCNNGDGDACSSLAGLYSYGQGVAQDEVKEKYFKEKACDSGDAFSCSLLGRYKDKAKVLADNCDNGNMRACRKIDPDKAKEIYKKKCDENDGESCFGYAVMIKEF